MRAELPLTLQPGERLPPCYGMANDGSFFTTEEQIGRSAVAVLAWAAKPAELHPALGQLAQTSPDFLANGTDLLLLGDEDVVRAASDAVSGKAIRLVDCGSRFLAQCGMRQGMAAVVLLDRSFRIVRLLPAQPESASLCLKNIPVPPQAAARSVVLPAPVLLIPNLFPPEICRDLIACFEAGGSVQGGIASIDSEGHTTAKVNPDKKRRRDFLISPHHPWYNALRSALLRRCAPEIKRAFQAEVTHTDRILIARYDDSGGWFRRHRDNVAPNVAFREFAISVNLNAGDYDGGHLLFPEHNDHRHAPPAGAGLIFSASLLHEAAPVTRGRRYVLLTFFHGDASEARRRASETSASSQ